MITLVPMDAADAVVRDTIAEDVLRPAVLEAALDQAVRALTETAGGDARAARLASVTRAIEDVDRKLAHLPAAATLDADRVRVILRDWLAAWRATLTGTGEDTREASRDEVRTVLADRVTFTPAAEGWQVTVPAALGRVVTRAIDPELVVASPTGFEPVFQP